MAGDPNKLKKTKEFGSQEIFFCLARVPQSTRLFAGASDFNVYDFDIAAEKFEPKTFSGHNSYVTGVTLAAASSREADLGAGTGRVSVSGAVGKRVGERAKEKGVAKVCFDRGGYIYHGRVKALAEGARAAGLEF